MRKWVAASITGCDMCPLCWRRWSLCGHRAFGDEGKHIPASDEDYPEWCPLPNDAESPKHPEAIEKGQ